MSSRTLPKTTANPSRRVVLCLDGDAAGAAAVRRLCEQVQSGREAPEAVRAGAAVAQRLPVARVPWHVVAEHVVSFLGHGDVAAAPPQPSPAALAAIAQVRASRFRAFVARSAGAAVNGIMGTLGHRTNRYHDSDHDGSDSE